MTTTTMKRSLALGAATALVALTAACSSGNDNGDAESAVAGAVAESAPRNAMPGAVAPESGTDSSTGSGTDSGKAAAAANRTLVTVRSVVKTGEVEVTRADLGAARDELDALLVALDGSIDSEQTVHDRRGDIRRSTLVLRVPVGSFTDAMDGLQRLGKVKHADSSAQDVTSQVIDVDERVQTLQNSLDRLQTYQSEAGDIEDLLRYEQQITQREAELQSLKAQQDHLADQTTLSTITLRMSPPPKHVAPPSRLDDAGFVAGLRSGWNTLGDAVVVVLTVVGAVLPFGIVLVAAGVPVWLLVRRLVARRTHPGHPTPAE